MVKVKLLMVSVFAFSALDLLARDVLLEFKGAGFVPTSHLFRSIYGHGAGMYGVELTGELYQRLYGFISLDSFGKAGTTQTFNTPTHVRVVNLGLGLKYLRPCSYGDWYVGLGVLPTYLHTTDQSVYVPNSNHNWGWGGILKSGLLIDLPRSFFLDLFADFAFDNIHFKSTAGAPVQAHNAKTNGFWLGLGLGYRFN